ncbi:MAG: hypothetical protein C4524_08830 [Candidatus Zixiibacteriota bacterium]|nr:MAG: hypothetical protein C4524_08830 [candidate division Zixibacteria bacterium]
MKKLLCFIDDSPEERALFAEVFGAPDAAFEAICAETFDEALRRLRDLGRTPDLFVLDLYFPGGEIEETGEEEISEPAFLPDQGDMTRAFLNLETARRRFQTLRRALGQTPAGGLELLRRAGEAFPGVPAVTYTRKGTIEEARRARRAGARDVLQKPSGRDWDDTRRLTRVRRGELEAAFEEAMAAGSKG